MFAKDAPSAASADPAEGENRCFDNFRPLRGKQFAEHTQSPIAVAGQLQRRRRRLLNYLQRPSSLPRWRLLNVL